MEFWNLGSQFSFKEDVFKILISTKNFESKHLKKIVEKVKERYESTVEASAGGQIGGKLGKEELKLLSENFAFRSKPKLKEEISDFYWKVLINSDKFNDDLLKECIDKY